MPENASVARVMLNVRGLRVKNPVFTSSCPRSGRSGVRVFSFIVFREIFTSFFILMSISSEEESSRLRLKPEICNGDKCRGRSAAIGSVRRLTVRTPSLFVPAATDDPRSRGTTSYVSCMVERTAHAMLSRNPRRSGTAPAGSAVSPRRGIEAGRSGSGMPGNPTSSAHDVVEGIRRARSAWQSGIS